MSAEFTTCPGCYPTQGGSTCVPISDVAAEILIADVGLLDASSVLVHVPPYGDWHVLCWLDAVRRAVEAK